MPLLRLAQHVSSLRRWLRHAWLGYAARDFFASQAATRPPRPPRSPLELERLEERAVFNDPIGMATVPLAGFGVLAAGTLLSPGEVILRGWYALNPPAAPPPAPTPPAAPPTPLHTTDSTAVFAAWSPGQGSAVTQGAGDRSNPWTTTTPPPPEEQPAAGTGEWTLATALDSDDGWLQEMQDGLDLGARPHLGSKSGRGLPSLSDWTDSASAAPSGSGGSFSDGGATRVGSWSASDTVPRGSAEMDPYAYSGLFGGYGISGSTTALDPGNSAAATNTGNTGGALEGGTVSNPSPPSPTLRQDFGTLPLLFEANRGQTDSAVQFLTRADGYNAFLTSNQAVLALNQTRPATATDVARNARQPRDGLAPVSTLAEGDPVRDVLQLHFLGANPNATLTGVDLRASRSNYFLGSAPAHDLTDIPNYAAVRAQSVYAGIDILYRGNAGNLQYDFVVAAGADLQQIAFRYDGAAVELGADGSLILQTASGTVIQSAPVLYQHDATNAKELVTGRYVTRSDGGIGFQVDAYDSTRELIIDPSLGFSTYLGGSGSDVGNAIAVDAQGNVYVTGETYSVYWGSGFPTSSPYDGTLTGSSDVIVSKLAADGASVLFSSYLGGTNWMGSEAGYGIAVDTAENIYVTGTTSAADFPTFNAYQSSLSGYFSSDAFVTKLSSAGNALVYSSYIGGSGNETGYAIAVDDTGSAYITGETSSSWGTLFPTTSGAAQENPNGMSADAFITKFLPDGSGLVYSSLLGDTGSETGYGLAVDVMHRAVIVGKTTSSSFPLVAADDSNFTGSQEAFVTRLGADGSAWEFSTFLGASGSEVAQAVAVNTAGELVVTGTTDAGGFTTGGAYQTTLAGTQDAFVARYSENGTRLATTLLGGTGAEWGTAIALDALGSVHVAGKTDSSNFPTAMAFQASSGGSEDAFWSKLSSDLSTLDASSYLGGSSSDAATGLALDHEGNAFLIGTTSSSNFPTAGSPFQATNGGSSDLFLTRIDRLPVIAITAISSDTGTSGSDALTNDPTLTISGRSSPGATVTLYRADSGLVGTTTADGAGIWSYDYTGTSLGDGRYAFLATATLGGLTSRLTAPFLVIVDLTAPTVAMAIRSLPPSVRPELLITVTDAGGLPNNATVTVDVDLNNDNDFLDTDETAYATGTLVGHTALVTLAPPLSVGTVQLRARVTDLAGNEGNSGATSHTVTSSGAAIADFTRRLDALSGDSLLQLGNLNVVQGLDLDLSPGTTVGGASYLSYNSERVDVKPILAVAVQTDHTQTLPGSISIDFMWYDILFGLDFGIPNELITSSLTPGDSFTFASQLPMALATGRYAYSITVTIDYDPTPFTQTVSGSVFVVSEEASPFGAGWTMGNVDRLVDIAADGALPAGKLRVYGGKHASFYEESSGSYLSPDGDNGSLTSISGGYRYTTPDGTTRDFDSSGNQTALASPDGTWRTTYTWSSGALVGIASSDGALTTLTYSSGKLATIETGPRTVTATVDWSNNLTNVMLPDGGVHSFVYDSNHKLVSESLGVLASTYAYSSGVLTGLTVGEQSYTLTPAVLQGITPPYLGKVRAPLTDELGRVAYTELDEWGRIETAITPTGQRSWSRDGQGWITAVTDEQGRITSYTLDSAGYVTQELLPGGDSRSYTYQSAFHALTQYTDERGYVTSRTYDGNGHLETQIDPTNQTTTWTWSSGLLVTTTNPLGQVTSNVYDGARRLQATIDALNGRVTQTYDSNGNVLTRQNQLGVVTTFTRDPLGKLLRLDDPLGMGGSYVYDPSGLILSSTDAAGTRSQQTYNSSGQVTRRGEGTGLGLYRSFLTEYDAAGQAILSRNPQGYSQRIAHDQAGRVSRSTDALGNRWDTIVNRGGEVTQRFDPLGFGTSYSYDSRGRVTRIVDPLGGVTTQIWDPASNLVGTIDPAGVRTSLVYDAVNRLVARTDGVGSANPRTTTWVYDAVGAVVDIITPGGSHTEYSYDALQRVLAVREAAGSADESETQYAWTAAGGLEQITAADGEITWNVLDARNRVLEQYSGYGTADEQSTTYDYQNAGWITQLTDALGQITTFDYNPFGEEIARTVAVGTGVEQTTTTLRDAAGAVTGTVVAGQAAWQTAYDALGQPIVQIDPLGNRTQAYYDAVGNRTGVKDARGQTSSTSYDPAGRPLTFTDALGHVTEQQYDARGRVVVVINARGYRTSYTYDSHDALIQIEDARNGLFTNLYDSSGRLETTLDALGRRTTTVYDSLNRVIAQVDALGQRTSTIYNAGGNIEATIDAAGRRTTYLYDSLRRQVGTIDALGNRTTQVLDAAGNVTVLINALNQRTTQVYDDRNRLQVTIDALNQRTTQVWDDLDRVVAVVDARGQRTSYLYDVAGRLTGTVDAQGQTTTRRYDANGNLLTFTDTLGNTTTTAYDALNRAYQTTDALGNRSTVVYDPMSNVVVAIDALGRRTSVVFDALDRAEVTIDALTNRTTAVYDAVGNQLAVVNARGYRTSTLYDALNRAEVTLNALGNRTTTVYDAVSNVSTVVDALNGRTTYTYDALHRLTATTNALNQTVSQTYDAVGNVVQSTNGRGFVTTSSYDALQRLVQVEDALNGLFTQLYDAVGNATVSINARGFRTTSVYDSLNRLQSRTDALNHTVTLLYDVKSRVTGQIDALGQRTTTTYDPLDRVVAVQDAGGGVATRVYDAVGNRVNAIDALGHKTTYLYDLLNRQTEIRDAQGGIVSLLYDSIGNNTAVVDPVGNRTSMVYDALNRLVENIDPRNKSATMAYDALNRLISSTDRLGQRRDYSFNAISQQTGEVWKDVGGSTVNTLTFTWDANGNRTLAADKNGAYTTTYDALDRATVVQGPFGLTLTQAYDAVGNRIKVEDSKGGVTTSIYNAVNLLTQRQFGGVGQTPLRFDQTYTARDELSGVTRYSDLAGTTLVGTSSYVYDNVGNTTSIIHKDGSGTTLLALTYTYDLAHRLNTDNVDGALHTYTYDNTNQLTGDGTDTFAFDLNGNPSGGGFTVTTGNLLTSDGTWTYTNNDAGQRTKKSLGASAETWTYSYDTRGQMDSAEQRATDGGTLLLKLVFTYDVDGRLIAQERWTSGTGTLTTRYGYDTASNNVWVDLDGSNALLTRYLRPDGMDALAARINAAGTASWHLTDRQGTVLGNTNAAGALANKNVYNSYGKRISQSNAAASDAYGYTGKVYQADLQFSYHWHRWYDTISRRWTTFDPIDFQAGDFNLQRYVGNGPTNGTDPDGLIEMPTGLSLPTPATIKQWGSKAASGFKSLTTNPIVPIVASSPLQSIVTTPATPFSDPNNGYQISELDERTKRFLNRNMKIHPAYVTLSLPVRILESDPVQQASGYLHTTLPKWVPNPAVWVDGFSEMPKSLLDLADALSYSDTSGKYHSRAFREGAENGLTRDQMLMLTLRETTHSLTIPGLTMSQLHRIEGFARGGMTWARDGDASDYTYHAGQFSFELLQFFAMEGALGGGAAQPESGGVRMEGLPEGMGGKWSNPQWRNPEVGEGIGGPRSRSPGWWRQLEKQLGRNGKAEGSVTPGKGSTGCFVAGTHLRTPEGSQAIERFRPGDCVLSRAEDDVNGPLERKVVLNTFVRVALLLELDVEGKTLKTTPEHPFYVVDRGWVAAGLLQVGDLLCSHDGSYHPVQRILDNREVTTVYNLEVADCHTYFVGCQEWGFSVWAHNADACTVRAAIEKQLKKPLPDNPQVNESLRTIAEHLNAGDVTKARAEMNGLGASSGQALKAIDELGTPSPTVTPPSTSPPAPDVPGQLANIDKKVARFEKLKLGQQADEYKSQLKTYRKHLEKYGQEPGRTTGETNRMERELQEYRRILEGRGKQFDQNGNPLD